MAQSKAARPLTKAAAMPPTTAAQSAIAEALAYASQQAKKQLAAQGQKLPTQTWTGSTVRNPAV